MYLHVNYARSVNFGELILPAKAQRTIILRAMAHKYLQQATKVSFCRVIEWSYWRPLTSDHFLSATQHRIRHFLLFRLTNPYHLYIDLTLFHSSKYTVQPKKAKLLPKDLNKPVVMFSTKKDKHWMPYSSYFNRI